MQLETVLIIRINLNRSKAEIRREVDEILKDIVPDKTKRFRKEWKLYLVAYDLKKDNPGLTNSQIATMLSDSYPDEVKDNAEAENVADYLKQAAYLINVGFQEYL